MTRYDRHSPPHAIVALLAIAITAGCGKRGDPEPPESAVPEAIDDLAAETADGAIKLSWGAPNENLDGSSPPELVGFQILHSYRPFGITDAIATPAELRFVLPIPLDENDEPIIPPSFSVTDHEPVVGAWNTYRVVSYSNSALESASSNLAVIAWEVPPGAPGKPRAIPQDESVYLEWTRPSARHDGEAFTIAPTYRVYRAVGEGALELQTPEPVTRATWTDRSVPRDEPLRYVVRAVLPADESWVEGPSSEAVEIIAEDLSAPPRPGRLVGSRTSRGVELRWDPVDAPDLDGYHVYRSRNGRDFERLTTAPTRRTGYRDERPLAGRATYQVTSVDRSERANESAPSTPIRVD